MATETLSETQPTYAAKRYSRLFGLPLTLGHYVVDGDHLAECTGLFSVTVKAVSLSLVRNMVVVQSPWQKLCRLFSVHIATADPAFPEFVVHNIRDGEAFAAVLGQAMDHTSCLRQSVTE